ncbi:protein of unknown function [Agreia sp. COWG]|nr:protein of unknown function [Agreia sp. COWG]
MALIGLWRCSVIATWRMPSLEWAVAGFGEWCEGARSTVERRSGHSEVASNLRHRFATVNELAGTTNLTVGYGPGPPT